MEKYAIYNFELYKLEAIQGDLSMGNEIVAPKMEHAYQNFESIFGSKGNELRVQKEKRRGEGVDKYPCHVLAHDSHLIYLRLENVKDVTVYESHPTAGPIPNIEKKKIPSLPPCNIIIDNREGKYQIVIEIYSPAWNNTNIVRDILQENWNRELEKFGLSIKIWSKMRRSEFWNYVSYRQKKEKRYIKKLTFRFPNAMVRPSIETSIGLSNHLKTLMSMINSLGAGMGELTIHPETDSRLLKKKLADIKNMVALCSSNDYSLSLTFDDNITYNCNENLKAELPLNTPKILDEFENGEKTLLFEYNIERWLDWVIEQTKYYQDAEQINPKPNKKGKRDVS